MSFKGQLRRGTRKIRIWLNLGLGKVAPLTHLIPETPRRFVRDRLTILTTPKDLRPYRPPVSEGKIIAPSGINLYGMFQTGIGLGQGTRLYAKSLQQSEIPCAFVNLDFVEFPKEDDSMDAMLRSTGEYSINLIHVSADQIERACSPFPHTQFDNHYNIGVWLWELDRLPANWIKYFDYVDELWVPSTFIANAAKKDTEKPVTVIPYGIETPVDGSKRADFGLSEDDFLVLAMYDSKSFASRKNPEGAIDAFVQAFSGRDTRAVLVLKVSNGRPEELKSLRERLDETGIRYYLITEKYPKPHLNALIGCCDAYISMHRSEGFGLVIAEAMNLCVPVVATGWSSNLDFMPPECTYLVGYDMIPVGDSYYGEIGNPFWADPHIDEAAAALRSIMEKPAQAAEKAAEAQKYIQQYFSIESSATKMETRYKEICDELKRTGKL